MAPPPEKFKKIAESDACPVFLTINPAGPDPGTKKADRAGPLPYDNGNSCVSYSAKA